MSNQGKRQASVRAVTGTASTYEGDWHALFDMADIPQGAFNGRFLQWLNGQIPVPKTNLPDAMTSYAVNVAGVSCWNEVRNIESTAFNPLDIPNCQLWLDSADRASVLNTGGAVYEWRDKSGNDRHAVQSTGARQPTYDILSQNNIPVVNSDLRSKSMNVGETGWLVPYLSGPNTIYVVGQINTTGTHRICCIGAATEWGLLQVGTAVQMRHSQIDPGNNAALANTVVETPYIMKGRRNGTSLTVSLNGASGSPGAGSDITIAFELGIFGRSDESTQGLNGWIGEVLIYSRDVTEQEDEQIMSYLSTKWGIAV